MLTPQDCQNLMYCIETQLKAGVEGSALAAELLNLRNKLFIMKTEEQQRPKLKANLPLEKTELEPKLKENSDKFQRGIEENLPKTLGHTLKRIN